MKARRKILKEANRVCFNEMTMRQLHRAVRICRHRGLVKDKVLVEAGFNPRKRANG